MKKFLFTFLIITAAFSILLPSFSFAQEVAPVYLTLFYGDGCPHCHKELLFLDKLQSEFPNLKIRKLEVWYNKDNANLMGEIGRKLNLSVSGVPLAIISGQSITGYLSDETTGQRIRELVQEHSATGCSDPVGEALGENISLPPQPCATTSPGIMDLPFLGKVDLQSWSLPVLTIMVAALDSLNPCAMWVLLFLISLLFGIENRTKMWVLGGAFLFASAASYFLFLTAWLNLFLFVGFIYYIRTAVGIFAIGSGVYYLREWWIRRGAGCHVTNEKRQEKIMEKLRQITKQEVFWLAFLGLMALGFVVNLIELVCSAGLPAIYTQILALAKLNPLQYYLYLLLYILIYILPSLIVFIVAMTTLRAVGFSSKYARWSNLIGGIIILLLGILLIFRPGLVMFG